VKENKITDILQALHSSLIAKDHSYEETKILYMQMWKQIHDDGTA
jgi:hypothetical protein